ncbi:MAG TPA: hypothetical protein VIC26_12580, partial [Marinagarivorans sp.]
SWAAQNVLPDNVFDAGDSQYSSAAVAARAELESKWGITDGGLWEPLSINTADPVDGGVETTFSVTPTADSPTITNYNWSGSSCPDGANGEVFILEGVTNDTTGSVTITPPNFGNEPFECEIVIELTLDGVVDPVIFNHTLVVTPVESLAFIDGEGTALAIGYTYNFVEGSADYQLSLQGGNSGAQFTVDPSGSNVVSVDNTGAVSILGSGLAEITALRDGASAAVNISVAPFDPNQQVYGVGPNFFDEPAAGDAYLPSPTADDVFDVHHVNDVVIVVRSSAVEFLTYSRTLGWTQIDEVAAAGPEAPSVTVDKNTGLAFVRSSTLDEVFVYRLNEGAVAEVNTISVTETDTYMQAFGGWLVMYESTDSRFKVCYEPEADSTCIVTEDSRISGDVYGFRADDIYFYVLTGPSGLTTKVYEKDTPFFISIGYALVCCYSSSTRFREPTGFYDGWVVEWLPGGNSVKPVDDGSVFGYENIFGNPIYYDVKEVGNADKIIARGVGAVTSADIGVPERPRQTSVVDVVDVTGEPNRKAAGSEQFAFSVSQNQVFAYQLLPELKVERASGVKALGETRTYNISWAIEGVNDITCLELAGDACSVTFEIETKTATVTWTLPATQSTENTSDQYELRLLFEGAGFWVSDEIREQL